MKVRSTLAVAVLTAIAASSTALAQGNRLLDELTSARVIGLNFVWDAQSPLLELNPPYSMALNATHSATQGMIPGGIAFASDMMFFTSSSQVGMSLIRPPHIPTVTMPASISPVLQAFS